MILVCRICREMEDYLKILWKFLDVKFTDTLRTRKVTR